MGMNKISQGASLDPIMSLKPFMFLETTLIFAMITALISSTTAWIPLIHSLMKFKMVKPAG